MVGEPKESPPPKPAQWGTATAYIPIALGFLLFSGLGCFWFWRGIEIISNRRYAAGFLYFSGATMVGSLLAMALVAITRRLRGSRRGVVAVTSSTGALGVRFRESPVLHGATLIFVATGACFCSLVAVLSFTHSLPWDGISSTRSYGYDVAASAFAVVFAYVLIEFATGRFSAFYLELSPEGIFYRSPASEQYVPWSAVTAVNPGSSSETSWQSNPAVNILFKATPDGHFRRLNLLTMLSVRDGPERISLRPDGYTIGAIPLYYTLRFYFDHPELRHELGTEIGLDRIQRSVR